MFKWNDDDAPESCKLPLQYEEKLTDFQRLLLLRCFRVDRIYRAITNFVTLRMGERYVTPPVISFEAIFEQSTPFSPVIFILSPGSEPASDLMKLAERSGFGVSKLKYLAMGQGQEKVGTLHKKLSFPLRISSINVTKSAVSCEFVHIY